MPYDSQAQRRTSRSRRPGPPARPEVLVALEGVDSTDALPALDGVDPTDALVRS